MISTYERIQVILKLSKNPLQELKLFFTGLGKATLFNFVKPLNFGEDQNLINQVIDEVSRFETKQNSRRKFPVEMEEYVKGLPTRQLLKRFNGQRNNPDDLFFCMKKELLTREHIPNKPEAREIRKERAKKKSNKLETKQKKLKEEVIRLREKDFSISAVAKKLRITTKEVLFFLTEAGLEDKIETARIEVPFKEKTLIGYRLSGEPFYETQDTGKSLLVTKQVKAVNPKHGYSTKFGINKD